MSISKKTSNKQKKTNSFFFFSFSLHDNLQKRFIVRNQKGENGGLLLKVKWRVYKKKKFIKIIYIYPSIWLQVCTARIDLRIPGIEITLSYPMEKVIIATISCDNCIPSITVGYDSWTKAGIWLSACADVLI